MTDHRVGGEGRATYTAWDRAGHRRWGVARGSRGPSRMTIASWGWLHMAGRSCHAAGGPRCKRLRPSRRGVASHDRSPLRCEYQRNRDGRRWVGAGGPRCRTAPVLGSYKLSCLEPGGPLLTAGLRGCTIVHNDSSLGASTLFYSRSAVVFAISCRSFEGGDARQAGGWEFRV